MIRYRKGASPDELTAHAATPGADWRGFGASEPIHRQRLYLHPVEGQGPDPRQHLRYQTNGTAYAHPPDHRVENDLALLNLNCAPLKEARSQVLEVLQRRLKRVGFTPAHVQRLLDELDTTRPTPYLEVAREYLRRKLRQVT